MRHLAAPLLAAVVFAAACGGDDATAEAVTSTTTTTEATTTTTDGGDGATTTTAAEPPSVVPIDDVEPVVEDLQVPWGLAFVDDDTFFVTERPGVVRVVEDGRLRDEPALTLDAVARGEGGLLGIALHPDFPEERAAFVYYTTDDGNRVARFDVADDLTLSGEQVILGGIPSAQFHDGGRIAFGPDGHLYVATGDAREPDLAPDLDSLAGKILRITADGDVPDDNPFEASPIWSYGHRNPQGLAWTDDGTMYASEHGPTGEFGLCCHDELNRIEPGGFYGWPHLAGTVEAAGGTPPAEPVDPVATSGEDTWAPAGLAAVPGPDGPVLLVAALQSEALLRFDITGQEVAPAGTALDGLGRLRVATVGPDGCLYVATSNTDGRGSAGPGDDQILRTC